MVVHMLAVVFAGLAAGHYVVRRSEAPTFDTSLASAQSPAPTPQFNLKPTSIDSSSLVEASFKLATPQPTQVSRVEIPTPLLSPLGGGVPNGSELKFGLIAGLDGKRPGGGAPGQGIGNGGVGLGTGVDSGLGGSAAGAVTFFKSTTAARRVVFIVDASTSMDGPRFLRAKQELMESISKLGSEQRFFVSFFSDNDYPMFSPRVASELLPPSGAVTERLQRWTDSVQLVSDTKPQRSLQRAFKLRPDLIFLLTDGDFNDDTVGYLMRLKGSKVRINTIGFDVQDAARDSLKRIAEHFRGSYTEVNSGGGS